MSGCSLEDTFAGWLPPTRSREPESSMFGIKCWKPNKRRIDEKKQQFSQTTKLTKVNESDPYEAFFFSSVSDETVKIELEAILPNPGRQIYELWLQKSCCQRNKKLGSFTV
jgi:hypothetical protein